ncbi:hypothetical protein [Pseudarthrobacter sp. IC2-21]|uniref:hypothetical protein n=1 Tax=Pseudarthrobacter sp. IC2-21 TaxID=3092262 RepID=UPI002A6A571E|nr:hypothetical protein [Pseudarthrobacter sp. IC2-21]
MKIRWTANNFGRSGILAISEIGDTQPPVDTFYLDYIVENTDQDRIAVAAALIFGAYANDRLLFESPISSEVSRSIELFLAERSLRVDPVSFVDNNSIHGDAIIVLDHSAVHAPPQNQLGMQRRIRLSLLPTQFSSGGLLTMNSLSVAANAWLHARLNEGIGEDVSSVAAAVLLSADLSAAGLALCKEAHVLSDSVNPDSLRALLESTGLSLVMGDHCN